MLILTASDVARVFDMSAAFAAVEEAALAHVQGRTASPPRTAMALSSVPAEFLVMPGAIDSQLFGLKIWYAFGRQHGSIPRSSAIITLVDSDSGMEILMDGAVVTDLRTGAMSGLAATRLAPTESTTLGVVGTGIQARAQVLAVLHACRDIDTVKVFSRNPARCAAFAEELQKQLALSFASRRITVIPADSAEASCRGSDVIVAATTSSTPVILDEWVGDRTLVCGVGSHTPAEAEIEPRTIGRASRVVVDTRAGAIDGAGDIAGAIEAGLIRRDEVIELGTLLSGGGETMRGKGPAVFKSVGFGAADTISARLVARRALELGLGTTVALHD